MNSTEILKKYLIDFFMEILNTIVLKYKSSLARTTIKLFVKIYQNVFVSSSFIAWIDLWKGNKT